MTFEQVIIIACMLVLGVALWSISRVADAVADLQRREYEREIQKLKAHDRQYKKNRTYRFMRFWTRQAVERLDREGMIKRGNSMKDFERALHQDMRKINWAAKKHGLVPATSEDVC